MSSADPNERTRTDPSAHKTIQSLPRVGRALFFSLRGIGAAFKHEAAFREEIFLGVVLFPLAILLPFSFATTAVICLSMSLVLITELLNSGLEWTIDYISRAEHPIARRVKDMGSAAVFISLFASGAIWVGAFVAEWDRIRAIWS